MSPTVILIRHGQANYALHDPDLTDEGVRQSEELQAHLRSTVSIADQVGLIIVSPFTRTIQTALHGLGWLIDRGVPVVVDAYWQENSNHRCDYGGDREVLAHKFPQFSFDALPSEYPAKVGPFAFTQQAVETRGATVRQSLMTRPEKVIAVVSHSAFLRLGVVHWRFANADYRVFDFTGKGDELVQWVDTEARGGGMGKSQKRPAFAQPDDFKDEFAESSEAEASPGRTKRTFARGASI